MIKKIFVCLLFISIWQSQARAQIVSEKNCKSYSIRLESHAGIYDDFLTLEKIKKQGGLNGMWKVSEYRQVIRFLSPTGIQQTDVQKHNLGHGMWMKIKSVIHSDHLTTEMIAGKVFFEIRNGKIGYSKTGVWLGTVGPTGKVILKWPTVDQSPYANPLEGQARVGGQGEKLKLEVFNPSLNEKFSFDSSNPGVFFVDPIVTVTPAAAVNTLKWQADPIAGTDIQVTGSGKNQRITFTKLPKKNSEFGKTKITASLNYQGCSVKAEVPLKVFFMRDAKNNPEGQFPNWFYYWKQTPAGKPQGQSMNVLYGGSQFHECANLSTVALFRPGFAYKALHVCDLSRLGSQFENLYPLLDRTKTPGHLGWRTSKGIDTFAVSILHEFVHFQAWHNWRQGKSPSAWAQIDQDQDGIPDHLENTGLHFDPQKQLTYMRTHPKLKKIQYDEEWMAYESMRFYPLGKFDTYDWAYPGKQWE